MLIPGSCGLKDEYEEIIPFFGQWRAHFHEINTPKQALAVLTDQKAEMQACARSNRFDSKEATFTALVRQYTALAKP